jgi:hypothetical protein
VVFPDGVLERWECEDVAVSKTVQFPIMGKVDICRMFLKRFYDLEHEYRQVAALIARAVGVQETARLVQRRMAIVAEAREIVNKMNIPKPHWYSI